MSSDSLVQLEECLWPKGFARDVWMVVDAARDKRIYGLLLECFYSSHTCLFAGALAPELAIAAPYLIQLEHDDKKTRKFIGQAWGNSWGVFLKCDSSRDSLRRHLRSFLTVRDPYGQRLLFRFYDPRVLRTYLPTCNSDELEQVFGPVECLWTESESSENLLEFRFNRGKLLQRTFSLAPGAPRAGIAPELAKGTAPLSGAQRRHDVLPIRRAQMEAFSKSEIQKFEAWMCTHLGKFFPQQCKALSDVELRALIQYGIRRAAGHNITSEREVCKFIDLMVVLGRDFDTDERLAWAGHILKNRRTGATKIRSLYEAAAAHLERS